jgi:alkanesulfonate monooxygenase SsuD/methylene tetrahydromethanopterin reductase-like flavin-dependent oxidoreductase (luciferase family)
MAYFLRAIARRWYLLGSTLGNQEAVVTRKPAVSLAAVPGRRRATVELAQRLERERFAGIYCPSYGDGLGLCEALALTTGEIPFGTSIANIYTRHPYDYAQTAALVHELSGGRFRFGIGVSHAPTHARLHVQAGNPLADIRKFVDDLRAGAQHAGALPPIVLAALRRRMVELAGEIAQGAVWANGARSHMAASLRHLPEAKRRDPAFFLGNMVPTCIDADRTAAAGVNRRTLVSYVRLPNYQNYWIEAGFADEMLAIREAIAAGQDDRIPQLMSDRWLSEVTLFGSAAEVRAGIEAWYETGITTLIVVPSSTRGGQMAAFEELITALR